VRSIALLLLAAAPIFAQTVRNAAGQISARPPVQPTVFDCAADGSVVNSVTGEPVARARITISVGDYGYSASTDSAGNWTLANMACAPGQIQVTRTGFLQNMSTRGPAALFRQINLTSGSPVHGLRNELVPQSVAWGKVVDDQGDPVQNVTIMALTVHIVEGRARMQQTGGINSTNDLGEYRISGLPRGKYIFCAHGTQPFGPQGAVPGLQMIPADTCYPGPVEGGSASAMDLPAGREAKVDFTITDVPAAHVRGTITGLPEGRGPGLRIVRRGVEFGSNLPGNVRDGKFDFRVPPGAYTLAGDYFENGARLIARVPVDVGTSDTDNIVVHFEPGFTVKGIVHVISPGGRTLASQFGISLRSSDPMIGGGQMRWDADHANFTINDLTPGTYRLEASPPPPFYVRSATLAGHDILNSEIPISQAAGPIDIQLRDDGGSIEGDVTDANGQALPANVLLLRGSIRVANIVNQTGHFRFQNLAPDNYTVCDFDDLNNVAYADVDWMRRNGGGCQALTVTAGQNQQIKLIQQTAPE
jgi:uncharacterized protein (DUF2141 family)